MTTTAPPAHAVHRETVDASNSRPHEFAKDLVTITVTVWCVCGHRAAGTAVVSGAVFVQADEPVKAAIEDAHGTAKAQHANHIESE